MTPISLHDTDRHGGWIWDEICGLWSTLTHTMQRGQWLKIILSLSLLSIIIKRSCGKPQRCLSLMASPAFNNHSQSLIANCPEIECLSAYLIVQILTHIPRIESLRLDVWQIIGQTRKISAVHSCPFSFFSSWARITTIPNILVNCALFLSFLTPFSLLNVLIFTR